MMSGEILLAAAIIEQVVKDARHGTAEQKLQARCDIMSDCLEYWIEIMSEKYDLHDQVHEELRRLADVAVA